MTSVAWLPPAVTGVKIICTVQLLPLVRAAPHVVFPVEKLAAPAPLIWNPGLAAEIPPVLLMVSVKGALGTPKLSEANVRLAGLTTN